MQPNKVLLISHIADPDGITPVILARLAFSSVDRILLEPDEVDSKLLELGEEQLDSYDWIFMIDLSPKEIGADFINSHPNLKGKFVILDHHIGKLHMNRYSFIQVVDEDATGKKQSGTSLFYQYLLEHCSNSLLEQPSVELFVDLVRSGDTWEWKSQNRVEAMWLGQLFGIFGKEYFEEHYYQYLARHKEFKFTDEERYLLEIEQLRLKQYVEKKETEMIPIQLGEYSVAVVFAEQYRSSLGNILAEKYQGTYDFVVLINVSRSVSYRGVTDVDLSKIAALYGGSGHIHASGSPLPKNLAETIITLCFSNAKLKKEEDHGL